MASLSSGTLLDLLRRAGSFPDSADDDDGSTFSCHTPAVLQITGIVPALASSDLSPDHGFYVRVSDSSHSTYVSLPPDLNDLILSDRLRLGQLLHVDELKPGSPVPALHGVHLLPSRYQCLPDGAELVSCGTGRPVTSTATTQLPLHETRRTQSRDSRTVETRCASGARLLYPSDSTSPTSGGAKRRELDRGGSDALSELKQIVLPCADDRTYDSDGSRSSSYASSAASSVSYSSSACRPKSRKSWDTAEKARARKRGLDPPGFRRNASISPAKFVQNASLMRKVDPMDAPLACKTNAESICNALNGATKRRLSVSNLNLSSGSCRSTWVCSSGNMNFLGKNGEMWLSTNLLKHGKEALRQRDLALQAAVDALLEASASQRLVQCLSTYLELQSDKDSDPQNLVARFLNFYHDLAQTKLITQSLEAPSKAENVALDKKHCATSWIKAALESDLSPLSMQLKVDFETMEVSATSDHLSTPITCSLKQKNAVPKESVILAALSELQYESNKWFLRHINKFLDTIPSDMEHDESHSRVASLLCQLKGVDDWLDTIETRKERPGTSDKSKEAMSWDAEEMEACGRVRRKIYRILLNNVENAAIALGRMHTTDKEKR